MCNPQILSDLNDSIKLEAANIPHAILLSALLCTVSRMRCIIACDGTQMEKYLIEINAFVCPICVHIIKQCLVSVVCIIPPCG